MIQQAPGMPIMVDRALLFFVTLKETNDHKRRDIP